MERSRHLACRACLHFPDKGSPRLEVSNRLYQQENLGRSAARLLLIDIITGETATGKYALTDNQSRQTPPGHIVATQAPGPQTKLQPQFNLHRPGFVCNYYHGITASTWQRTCGKKNSERCQSSMHIVIVALQALRGASAAWGGSGVHLCECMEFSKGTCDVC